MRDTGGSGLSQTQYAAIAAFRHELRKFLAFSEGAAAGAGLPPQQHQALLTVAGHLGEEAPSIGALADHLLIAPHTAAELVARMTDADLLIKSPSPRDRRRMELTLTPKAWSILERLTEAHLKELRTLEAHLARAVGSARHTLNQG